MKPIILTFTSFYLPGYRGGGPIRTIANMVERLGDDFDFRIVTSDRDMGDTRAYPNIHVDAWNVVGNSKVFYARAATRSVAGFAKIMRETPHDILYLNSFFDPRFTLAPIFARWLGLVAKRPVVVAPRGEFSIGALHIKAWKKKPFVQLTRISRLFGDAFWHASTELEAADIQRVLRVTDKSVHVARNTIVAPDLFQSTGSCSEPKNGQGLADRTFTVCFLSRIVPMKNLEFALGILARVSVPVALNIYGPKEDLDYWLKCKALINELPSHISARDCGSVDHVDVRNVIAMHDLFFVPSLGENFGHVFMEALSAGVPILVSDQTPWRDLELRGLGWDIPLSCSADFVSSIEQAAKFSSSQRKQMKVRCLEYAQEKSDDTSAVELNRALFVRALASSS